MGFYVEGLGYVNDFNGITLDEHHENFRSITYNNRNSFDYGLIMSGLTPLLPPKKPKRQTIEIPYAHGSIDVSQADGQLYFEDREITYNFAKFITRDETYGPSNENDHMNRMIQTFTASLEDWLNIARKRKRYSGQSTEFSKLYDSCFTLNNARCTGINISKTFKRDYWVLTVQISFKGEPDIPAIASNVQWKNLDPGNVRRDIWFNNNYPSNHSLYMTGSTPLSQLVIKRDEITSNIMQGSIDRSYQKGDPVTIDGVVYDKYTPFYQDRTISYSFMAMFKSAGLNCITKNRACQAKIESVSNWLYGNTMTYTEGDLSMKGCPPLKDSSLTSSGYHFPFGRCTNLSVQKQITNDYWMLVFTIGFTVYPIAKADS